ncbi:hypothetical protein [Streptomyces sp. NPDC047000]|uniref:hypothetical protein n=1 Tax=Streptomyces sp. NPDC047000 TaxID=3155474 RepID=UPI0034032F2D
MAEISRRTVLGTAGPAAAAVLLTTAGTAGAADAAKDRSEDTLATTIQETDTPMAVTTEEQKYEAYVVANGEERVAQATFAAHSDVDDMWAYVDAALTRLRAQNPNSTFTGNVQRYDQVITDIAHP